MELWARNCPVILPKFRLTCKFRDLFLAANLRHGTDDFTSPPKEGVLRIFSLSNIRGGKVNVTMNSNDDFFLIFVKF